jgi:hypothetical protein
MPTYRISGRGKKTNRKRSGVYRAIDRATALAMAEAAETVVSEVVQLPEPPPTPAQLAYARSVGLKIGADATRTDVVVALLQRHARRQRIAEIVYLTTIDGAPWTARVEPYIFQPSREGLRLRCFVLPTAPEPDVIADFQESGWHLYLVEDIEDVRDGGAGFVSRPYRRSADEVSITIELLSPDTEPT